MKFTKMHGIGNDFVMVNGFAEPIPESSVAELARRVCDRRFGVGSDGLIVAAPGTSEQFAMRMWNPDGSESEMCGNGIRCFASFVRDEGLTSDTVIPVETGAGRLVVEIQADGRVRVDMGKAWLRRGEIGMTGPADETFIDQPLPSPDLSQFGLPCQVHGTAVSMGNPHVVVFVADASTVVLDKAGPMLEHNELFPRRVNAHFVQVLDRSHVLQRTWERGAGATLACGTGACACAVASFLTGRSDKRCIVSLPGGDLEVEYADDGHVFMTGPADAVFEGEFEA
ncbi:MAG: diaminopimelate epimerase [Armatimonadetes bacterium]|nr:diaminopimelate epimerase [Armatimonadota bacterium]